MVALELSGEPQAVVPRHHHVDDGQVVVARTQRGERFIRSCGSLRLQAERRNPARHDVPNCRLVVDDQNRGHWCHGDG